MTDQPASSKDPIFAQECAAIEKMFSATIAALGADVQKILASNGSAPNYQAVEQLTSAMIALLAERVKSVLPNTPPT